MKKFGLSVLALALGFTLTACGEKKTTETATETTTAEGENYDDPSLALEAQEKDFKKVKVTEQKSYSSIDPYTEETDVSAHAIIENKSELPMDLSEVTVTFKKKDGTVAYVAESHEVYMAPYILKPGEKGYVSVDTPLDIDPQELGDTDIKISPTVAIDDVKSLETEKETLNPEENRLSIKGIVKNNLDETVDDGPSIGAALYDAEGNFLATIVDGSDTPLSPGDSVGFDAYTVDLPAEVVQKVDSYKVSAIHYIDIE